MSDSKQLVEFAGDAALERDFEAETKPLAARLAHKHHEIVDAAQHFADDEEELAKLPPKARRIAEWSRLPKQELPYAIQMAHEFSLMRERRMQAMAPKKINLTIGQQNNNYGVSLPPRATTTAAENVVIVESEVNSAHGGDE
jgi:hypothetical protein